MRIHTNECVQCQLSCNYNLCQYYNVERFYCDECGNEETLYDTDFGELCELCLLKKFPKIEGSDIFYNV